LTVANSDYVPRAGGYGFCPVGYLTADITQLQSSVTMTGYTSPVEDGIRIGMAAMIANESVNAIPGSAPMHVGSIVTNVVTVLVPTHSAGDVILVIHRNLNEATPGTLSGFTSFATTNPAFGYGSRAQYAVDAGNTITTITNPFGHTMQVHVFRGCGGIGSVVTHDPNTANTSGSFPTLTLNATDGSSRVLACLLANQSHSTAPTDPAGMTLLADANAPVSYGGGDFVSWLSDAGVTTFTDKTTTWTTNAYWVTYSIEILGGEGITENVRNEEIVVVTARTGNNLTLARGCCDTVPALHSTGDAIWFFDDSLALDVVEYTGTETIGVKVLPRTSSGAQVPVENSPPVALTFNLRFARPYPPGLVEVNGAPWFTTPRVLSLADPSLDITWAHRNRITQEDQLIDHLQGDVIPELGTTYELRVYRADDTLLRTVVGETGTAWSYSFVDAVADFSGAGGDYPGYITLISRRDGLASFQQYRIDFTFQSSTTPIVGGSDDPDFENVILLVQDGVDGSLLVQDRSTYADSVTISNYAAFDDAQQRFDNNTIKTVRTAAAIAAFSSVGSASRFGRETGDKFSFECWAYVGVTENFSTSSFFFTWWGGSGRILEIGTTGAGGGMKLRMRNGDDGALETVAFSSGAWHFVQLNVDGNAFTLDLDGVLAYSGTNNYNIGNPGTFQVNVASQTSFGNDSAPSTEVWVTPLRVTKGVLRARGSVPTAEFPTLGVTPPPDTTDTALTIGVSLPVPPAGASISTNLTQSAVADTSTGERYQALFYHPSLLPQVGAVILDMSMNGQPDASTTFTDASVHAHLLTAVRNAQITTSSPLEGSGSLLVNHGATNLDADYVRVGTPGSTPTQFRNFFQSDFTIRGKALFNDAAGGTIFSITHQLPDLSFIGVRMGFAPATSGALPSFVIQNIGEGVLSFVGATQAPVGVPFDFAIVGSDNGQVRCYVNGVNSASFYYAGGSVPQNYITFRPTVTLSANPTIGGGGGGINDGKLDSIIINKFATTDGSYLIPSGVTLSMVFGIGLSESVSPRQTLNYTTSNPTSKQDAMAALIAQVNSSSVLGSYGLTAHSSNYAGSPAMVIEGPIGLRLHSSYGLMSPGVEAPVFRSLTNLFAVEFTLGSPVVPTGLNQIVTATLTGTPAVGDKFTITLGSVAFTYTALTGATLNTIATALAALIDADTAYAASAIGAVITIDGVTPTNRFAYFASTEASFAFISP
jgi:hypothetical protein